ncbi:unnamed protein product [Caenorhabditis bovis]|uniref:Uncharacterized protein n=1 Tax=Caenorhabditis bovis TaxID=2654633 RepID=A0A8S1FDQ4_9PELO|nr:unnamed protein product [Caenorhabditis bovis]
MAEVNAEKDELMQEQHMNIDHWMDEQPVEEVVIGQDGTDEYVLGDHGEHMLDENLGMEYDDGYPSLLPIRDGIPVLSLNLPDLLSKTITFTTGMKMTLCFNKRCQRQVTFNGYLYTIDGYVHETSWNLWKCVNPMCPGAVRTTGNWQELRVHSEHDPQCLPDSTQIRLRISIYDLRLMAEFTELPLEELYQGCGNRLKSEDPQVAAIFPSFEAIKLTLEDHRYNKIYRKRFEMQTLKDKQKKLHMTPDEVVYAESTAGMIKFRRTKPFPPSICYLCGEAMQSNSLPSQDQLIGHLLFSHGKQLIIERFVFKEVNLFEQYMRELNVYSRHRMKRMGLADENMYFLCSCDDRLGKTGNGRAGKNQDQNTHCTAFIRVFDWRLIVKRETEKVVVDYCLEHPCHDALYGAEDCLEFFTPEAFVRESEDRKLRTQKFLDETSLQRLKRPIELRSVNPTTRLKSSFGSRSMAPPIAAQIAGGNTQPYVDSFYSNEDPNIEARKKYRTSIREIIVGNKKNEDSDDSSQPTPSTVRNESTPPLSMSPTKQPPPPAPQSRLPLTNTAKDRERVTIRTNFKEIYTFNAVTKIEDACIRIVQRLQNCRSNRVALGYKDKIKSILNKALSDPALADDAPIGDHENSWVLAKNVRGRPRKIAQSDDDDDDDDGVKDGDEQLELEEDDAGTSVDYLMPEQNIPQVAEELVVKSEMLVEDRGEFHHEAKTRSRKRAASEAAGNQKRKRETSDVEPTQFVGESRSGRVRKLPAKFIE